MRAMLGNAQFLSGVIKTQIEQGHAASEAASATIEQAKVHAASLKAQIQAMKG